MHVSQQVEVQVISKVDPVEVCLVLENFPVWLLVLEPSKVHTLHILGFSNHNELKEHLLLKQLPVTLLDPLVNRFGSRRIRFVVTTDQPPTVGLLLVSGSLQYIDSYVEARSSQNPLRMIGVVDHHFHG
jgi:hypothetical protein